MTVTVLGDLMPEPADRIYRIVQSWKSTRLLSDTGDVVSWSDLMVRLFRQRALLPPNLEENWTDDDRVRNSFGPPWLDIAGIHHYKEALLDLLRPHMDGAKALYTEAVLTREPENPADTMAVRVDIGRTKVGYLRARDAERYASVMDVLGIQSVVMAAVFRISPKSPGKLLGHLWPAQLRTPGPNPCEVWDPDTLDGHRSWYTNYYDWPPGNLMVPPLESTPVQSRSPAGCGCGCCGGRAAAAAAVVLWLTWLAVTVIGSA